MPSGKVRTRVSVAASAVALFTLCCVLTGCPQPGDKIKTEGDDDFVLDGFQDGVRGFVLKTQPSEDLVQAIREVSHGGMYVGPGSSRAVVDACRAARTLVRDPLSERERQVLQLVAEGKTTKEVAALLQISVRTADYHRTRVMKRLNIHDTAGLVRYAIRHGFVAP